ncbi:MAG: hypothetical protein GQ532_17090, partial [Methylomarinum sp.]|nr:hypothetical protein [Methylomarinum sp.]
MKVFVLFANINVFVGWVEITKPRINRLHHIIAGFRTSTQPTLNTFTASKALRPIFYFNFAAMASAAFTTFDAIFSEA